MASAKSKNGESSNEVLLNLKYGDKSYIPGDKIKGLKKDEAESLLLQGVIGKSGSFKKQQEQAELLEQSGGSNTEDVLELVKNLKNEIQELKQENKRLLEASAKQ